MIVKCPQCEAKYKLDPAKLTSAEPKIRCKKCSTVFKAVEEKPAATPPPAAPAASEPPPTERKEEVPAPAPTPAPATPAPTPVASAPAATTTAAGNAVVVVGHESEDVTSMVEDLLGEEGFTVVAVHDGIQALMEIEQRKPAVAILDVALPKMFGFEICEVIRRDDSLAGTRTVLIAAIYDKTRYKRSPASLYGADDYVEKHRIPEDIVEKIKALVGGSAPAGDSADAGEANQQAPAPAAPQPQAAAPQAPAAPAAAPAFDESTLSPQEREDHEKAKRLARIIASDVALYNPDAMAEGLRNGNPMDALRSDIEEGRKLYIERVPAAVREKMDYLTQALEDLFEKKRKDLGIGL